MRCALISGKQIDRTVRPAVFSYSILLSLFPGFTPHRSASRRSSRSIKDSSNPVRHQNKNKTRKSGSIFVPGQGFEPQFSDSESDVLPLDDPGIHIVLTKRSIITSLCKKKTVECKSTVRCLSSDFCKVVFCECGNRRNLGIRTADLLYKTLVLLICGPFMNCLGRMRPKAYDAVADARGNRSS